MEIKLNTKSRYYLAEKRALDVLLSIVALIILSPVFLVIWIFDCFGSNRGPVFYKQERVGKDGKLFYIYKFRSMVVDADKKLMENEDLYIKYIANSYKLPDGEDPRITKLGSFLRKTSIDEIPQFINILRGDMSIIGPRPVIESEITEYGDRKNEFLSVKPGALGYWQAIGRSNIGYPERCDVELYYVSKASLRFDVSIFFKNIVSIMKREGAF